MMKLLLVGFLSIVSCAGICQSDTVFIKSNAARYDDPILYETDTVVFDTPNARSILYGTTILPNTSGQVEAMNFGISLRALTETECRETEKPIFEDEVVTTLQTKDSVLIEVKISANCCHSFLCDVEIVNDETINLLWYGYGATYCACTCCFGLTYHFSIEEYGDKSKLKNIMINGERKTLAALK